MADVKMTLDEASKRKGRVDLVKVDATTEEEVRRQMIKDGLDPDNAMTDARVVWPPAIVRAKTGLSQAEFAKAIGVPVATLRNWEQGRVGLDPAVKSLFALINDNPKRALKVLQRA